MLLSNIITSLFAWLAQFAPVMSSNHQAQTSVTLPATKYEAKLVCDGPQAEVAPAAFIVHLRPGHTLQQHSAAINTDIMSYVRGVLSLSYKDNVVYVGVGISDDLLKAIRGDEGVLFVACDYLAHEADMPTGEL